MNHLKDYHIQRGIYHFLTFADENAGKWLNKKFSTVVTPNKGIFPYLTQNRLNGKLGNFEHSLIWHQNYSNMVKFCYYFDVTEILVPLKDDKLSWSDLYKALKTP